MDLLKDSLILLTRIVTILPLLLIMTLFMGRRSIGELPIFDFLILMSLGAVVGADIADPKVEHIHTAVAIVMIAIFQKIIAYFKIHSRSFGKKITFEPIVVIKDGAFLIENLKRIRYSIDNILYMLRQSNVFDISVVKIAVIESNGQLTVQKKASKEFLTRDDLQIANNQLDLAYPLIIEGKIYEEVLTYCNQTKEWLLSELKTRDIENLSDIFFASLTDEGKLHVSLYSPINPAPPLHH
ncbi:DUF421 domain-containing protein [Priestia flexa]|uniref:DUF421 domain-containing protein n=1 Tax=Priestia flexa TaxID=86664 RepID=UPI00077C1E47|nr:DUF421 domain-containing protein [Priestia flexa]MED4587380.1 DUF421 domain-containing protein [Priestia flexa]